MIDLSSYLNLSLLCINMEIGEYRMGKQVTKFYRESYLYSIGYFIFS